MRPVIGQGKNESTVFELALFNQHGVTPRGFDFALQV